MAQKACRPTITSIRPRVFEPRGEHESGWQPPCLLAADLPLLGLDAHGGPRHAARVSSEVVHMFKRMFLMLAVMIVFLTAIGTVKYMQVKAAVAQFASFQPPPEAVTTIVSRQDRWPAVLGSI